MTKAWDIEDEFDPVDRAAWRVGVEAGLDGKSYEEALCRKTLDGLLLDPLPDADGLSLAPVRPAARGWKLRPSYVRGDIAGLNRSILRDLKGGADSIHLNIDATSHEDGIRITSQDDMAALLDGVYLDYIPVSIDAGAEYATATADLLGLYKARGIDAEKASIHLNADPLAVGAGIDGLATLARSVQAVVPNIKTLGVDVTGYHDRGASAVQELGFAIATGIYYMRAMEAAGMAPEETASQLTFRMAADQDVMMSIAKFRALRGLWVGVLEACGVEDTPMILHGETSGRMMADREIENNIMRTTAAAFAAAVGGADSIGIKPYDYAIYTSPDIRRAARRTARNISHVLQEESHLGRVADAAGGAFAVERLTGDLTAAAWALVQQIEAGGGMAAFIGAGRAEEMIAAVSEKREAEIKAGERLIIGVNGFRGEAS